MNNILEPLLAILAICFPLAMTYVIVSLQLREPDSDRRKASAIARDDPLREGAELSRTEEKHANTIMLP